MSNIMIDDSALEQILTKIKDEIDTELTKKTNPVMNGSISINRKSNSVIGTCSVAVGKDCVASGDYSFAEGYASTASGDYSHAAGYLSQASGNYAFAEGHTANASGQASHAEGQGATAAGFESHAEGLNTYALGDYSHAEGGYTTAADWNSHAEGSTTRALKTYAHAEGLKTTAGGIASHSEGNVTLSTASYAHAEGYGTTASGQQSHAEGQETYAGSNNSHAEGRQTQATNDYSHAEGNLTTASGDGAHAENGYNLASGSYSHAEGMYTTASGDEAHAEGQYTIAKHRYQHVFGSYNKPDPSTATTSEKGNYIEIVGNGTISTTSNARTLDWAGNEILKGGLTLGGDRSGTMGTNSLALGPGAVASAMNSIAVGGGATSTASNAIAVGGGAQAYGPNSIALGGRTDGRNALCVGAGNVAQADGSFAQGAGSTATGVYSAAQGGGNLSSGVYSHAEGNGTTASGQASHSEGNGTIANHAFQHVFGLYNEADPSTATASEKGDYIEIVGNGTVSTHSNARTLDWEGNETLSGGLEISNSTATGVTSLNTNGLNVIDTNGTVMSTVDSTGGHYYVSSTGSKALQVNADDITLLGTNDTWDGTHTSLKEAIAASGGGSSESVTRTSIYTGSTQCPSTVTFTGGYSLDDFDEIAVDTYWFDGDNLHYHMPEMRFNISNEILAARSGGATGECGRIVISGINNALQNKGQIYYVHKDANDKYDSLILTPSNYVTSNGVWIKEIFGIKYPSTPTPSEWTYNWDFTQSLVDSVQGETIVTGSDVSTANGLSYTYEDSGVVDDYLCKIPVDFLSPNKQIEIDFGTCDWDPYATYNPVYIGWFSPQSTAPVFSGISYNTDDGGVCAGVTETNLYDTISSSVSPNVFSNSTMRIVTSMSANNNLQWSIYKVVNGETTLIGTTNDSDVLTYDTDYYHPTASDFWAISVCGNGSTDYPLVVTGLRIKDIT